MGGWGEIGGEERVKRVLGRNGETGVQGARAHGKCENGVEASALWGGLKAGVDRGLFLKAGDVGRADWRLA